MNRNFLVGAHSRTSSPGLDDSLEDDDIEVDVEECSDGESAHKAAKTKASRQSPVVSECSEPTDIEPDSPELAPEKTNAKPNKVYCNCDELLSTECHLETKDLWDKFHDLGTEMIITKTGR